MRLLPTTATAAAEFRTVTTSRVEVERLIRDAGPAVVVIEACTLAGWVHDLCAEIGVPCKVANTAAEPGGTSTPKEDRPRRRPATRTTGVLGQIPEVVVPAKAVREWRALIAHRQGLPRHLCQRGGPVSAPSWSASGCQLPTREGVDRGGAGGHRAVRLALADAALEDLWRAAELA